MANIAALASELLDACTNAHHDPTSEETFTECLVCAGWEEHAPACFVPALEVWLKGATT
jgi:hypothetical protein